MNIFSWHFAQIFILDNTLTVIRLEKNMRCWLLLQVVLRIFGSNFVYIYHSICCKLFNIFFTKFCTDILANTLMIKEGRKKLALAFSLRIFLGIVMPILGVFFHVMKNSKYSHILHKNSWYYSCDWEVLGCFWSTAGYVPLILSYVRWCLYKS